MKYLIFGVLILIIIIVSLLLFYYKKIENGERDLRYISHQLDGVIKNPFQGSINLGEVRSIYYIHIFSILCFIYIF